MIRMKDHALRKAQSLTHTIAWVGSILLAQVAWLIVLQASQLAIPSQAFAQDVGSNAPVIFDVRRSLPLEPDEPVYRDFYVSVGPERGIRKGMYLTVVRQIPVHNPIVNKQQAMLDVTVGRLKVIHVEHGISVARLESELDDEDRPTLEFEGIMIGDKIDLASSSMDASVPGKAKPKGKGKADAKAEASAPVAAAPTENGLQQLVPVSVPDPAASKPEASAPPTTAPPPQGSRPSASAPLPASIQATAPAFVATGGTAEKAFPPATQPGMVRVPVPSPVTPMSSDGTPPRRL